MGKRDIWYREDIREAIKKLTLGIENNDIMITLKWSNRNNNIDDAWNSVQPKLEEFKRRVFEKYGNVRSIIFGMDVFASGYPHVNAIIRMGGEANLSIVQGVKRIWEKVEPWNPASGSYAKLIKTTQVRFNPFTCAQYLFKRALQCRKTLYERGMYENMVMQMTETVKENIYFHENKRGRVKTRVEEPKN